MKNRGEYKRYLRNKKSVFLPVTIIIVVAIFILSFVSIHVSKKIRLHFQSNPSITKLTYLWKNNDYQGVFDTSSILIEKKSLNNTILTYRGYSAYYLAISETDLNLSQEYIDEAIKCLRKALMTAKESTIAQIKYMLGRSYFYKNRICAYHYYADLVVKYLEEAKNLGYKADDIAETLGISYGQLNMPYESISRFSEALLIRESDSLLLSIAEQYFKLDQISAAKQYLFQVISDSKDDNLLIKAQTLLGKIYIKEEKYDEAKDLFLKVLDKDSNSTDAHYSLGLIYEKNGDVTKARAQWRKVLKIDNTHEESIKKMYR